jgi:hypothetical protein
MKQILDYLKEPTNRSNIKDIYDFDKFKIEENFNNLLSLIPPKNNDINLTSIKLTKPFPNAAINQLWLVKQNYIDNEGNFIAGSYPHYVLTSTELEKMGDMEFIRVQPISMFLNFASEGDIIVENEELTGFEFFIETWNEQPIQTSLLDQFIGELNTEEYLRIENAKLSNEQKEFRKYEIRNTEYLRNSVTSFLSWDENKQSKNTGVIINIGNVPYYPPVEHRDQQNNQYLVAAKSGGEDNSEYFTIEENTIDIPYEIVVKKESDVFTIVIDGVENKVILTNNIGEIEECIIMDDQKVIIQGLEKGTFTLEIDDFEEKINVRLK